jgi:hypothetical protein
MVDSSVVCCVLGFQGSSTVQDYLDYPGVSIALQM